MKMTTPLRYPVKFLEAMQIIEEDPIDIIQRIVNGLSFYSFFYGEGTDRKKEEEFMFLDRLKDYEFAGENEIDNQVFEISARYLSLLKTLRLEQGMCEKEKVEKSIPIFHEWEMEVLPLLDYARELFFTDGRRIDLAFEYNLICITCNLSPEEALYSYLNYDE